MFWYCLELKIEVQVQESLSNAESSLNGLLGTSL